MLVQLPSDQTETPSVSSRSWQVQVFGLVVSVVIVYAVAALGAAASTQVGDFYTQLKRPTWAPPGWLFGPAWSVLYTLMAVAAWLVWRVGSSRAVRGAMIVFLVQLAVNGAWSWLFFAWRLGAWSFVDIVLLWMLIVATMVCFFRVQRWAGVLLIPYLVWVTYAAALNFAIWRMNPELL